MYFQGNDTKKIDVKSLSRAAIAYYNILQQHCQGTIQLPPESIKFFSERLLENVLLIEQEANDIYESFSDEEKAVLAEQEDRRNKYYSDGTEIGVRGIEEIKKYVGNVNKRYDAIHEDAYARVNGNGESDD